MAISLKPAACPSGAAPLLEFGLDAEHGLRCFDRQAHGFLHRAPTGLAHPHRDVGLQLPCGDGKIGQAECHFGAAVDIGLRKVGQRLLDHVGPLVHQAELIVLPVLEGRAVSDDRQVGFEVEASCGRSEQIAPVD
jgi:hypothetical protein